MIKSNTIKNMYMEMMRTNEEFAKFVQDNKALSTEDIMKKYNISDKNIVDFLMME